MNTRSQNLGPNLGQNLDPPSEQTSELRRTIMIRDENPVLAETVLQLIRNNTVLSHFATTVIDREALRTLPVSKPDILIVDPWQSAVSHNDAQQCLIGLSASTSVIGYTSSILAEDRQDLGEVVFKGIIPKTVPGDELVRIVCAVAFGGVYLPAATASDDREPAGIAQLRVTGPVLSDREIDVLRNIALGRSLKEIAANLSLSTKTVDTYKSRATQKLNLRSRSDVVRYAIQSGWLI